MTTATALPNETDMATLHAQGAELLARDRWTRRQLLDFQRERRRALIAHAATSSPYYRDVLGPDARSGDVRLDELPTLSKATLVDEFDRIVTDPRIKLADLNDYLAGPDPAGLFLGRYRAFATSGTTGMRALVVYSEEEFRSWVATSLRLFGWIGITPQTRLAPIGAPNHLHITRQLFAAFRSGRTGAPHLSVLTPLDETVAVLNRYQPEAIVGYASLMPLLAQEQLDGALRIEPRIIGVSSEVLTEEGRYWIKEAWGVEPTQVYSSTETLYMASSIPPHPGMNLYEDLSIVEVVDEHNRPVPPGVPGFKVLVTNLVNYTQPLIRYEISDSLVLAEDGPNPTGRPFRQIASVDGRSDDILRFPALDGGEVAVHPYRLRTPFAALGEVRQYQIVSDGESLRVRVVLQPSAPRETPQRVHALVRESLEDAGALAPPVEVVVVDAIEREGGHAAKLKLVKKVSSLR